MNWRRALPILGIAFLLASQAVAADPWRLLFGRGHCQPDCVGQRCCDDYVAKCPPAPKPVRCFACDHYRGKCAPAAKPVECFKCDDYCRKPFCLHCPPSQDLKCRRSRAAEGRD